MIVFLDTSALVKLYSPETGTAEMDLLFSKNITRIYLSKISLLEFESAIRKKVRTGHLTQPEAEALSASFMFDLRHYQIVDIGNSIIENAWALLKKYGHQGLRTLDSIQLATAISLRQEVTVNKTFDTLLEQLFVSENLPIR
ncbi:type II toxin-antitoxin system VapC family toxin [Rhodoflexus caldus]|uniref:type II toxin-antitoxin system VapC family toxin n=1 Tax=Rhodoflexus caldus TaxID=2891236 RepID=UPI002029C38F|nr:type II toxin-antitoxin system VapC family toxin [Rhodoflexus caldus]